MKEIFISYSSRESELAGKVCSLIESNGYNCFIASRDITPGHEYAAELVVALEDCIAAVTPSPVSTPLKGLDVIEARRFLRPGPAAFCKPVLIRLMP